MKQKAYLGDAVYAEINQFGNLVLTTEDGIKATNRIVLEPDVLEALQQYIEEWTELQTYLRGQEKQEG